MEVTVKVPQKEYEEMKEKAEKWDKLDKKIEECYGEESTDLCTIGEDCLLAFGYL